MSKLIRNVAPLEVTIRRSSSPRIGLLSHATPPPPPKGQLEESSVRIIDPSFNGDHRRKRSDSIDRIHRRG